MENNGNGYVVILNGILSASILHDKFRPPPPPPPPSTTVRPANKVRPLDYYYQFISVNVVDGTSRGGDAANLITNQVMEGRTISILSSTNIFSAVMR